MKRKLLSICLIMGLLFSVMPGMAFAADESSAAQSSWADTENYDTTWYDESASEYVLTDAADLAGLAVLVNAGNSFTGKTVTLANDIDLSGHDWMPIGCGTYTGEDEEEYYISFSGTFDGQGHMISGMNTSFSEGDEDPCNIGLFGTLGNATVKNVEVIGKIDPGPFSANWNMIGGLAGCQSGGLLENCTASVQINIEKTNPYGTYVGGLTGYVEYGNIENCVSNGEINISDENTDNTGGFFGGIAGQAYHATISNSKASNQITTSETITFGYFGGIVGQLANVSSPAEGDTLVEFCYFSGKIDINYENSNKRDVNVGGIAGGITVSTDSNNQAIIRNCFSTGQITVKDFGKCGAIVGEKGTMNPTKQIIENCFYEKAPSTSEGDGTLTDEGTQLTEDELKDKIEVGELGDWEIAGDGSIVHPSELADYSAVEAALVKIPADYPDAYTEESVQALEAAKNAVQYGLLKDAQETVNGYAAAIESAIAALEKAAPPEPPYTGKYSYEIFTDISENGTLSVDRYATEGDKVTIDVSPDEAYLLDELTITSGGKEVEVTDNGDGTFTFTMPSGDVEISATFAEDPDWTEPEPEPEPSTDVSEIFLDVAPNAWYKDAVQYAYDNGLMTGVSATEFVPDQTTTRAMIVSILARLENVTSASDAGFSDVDDEWFATAVNWAASENIVAGFEDNSFRPNDAITREQLAAILMNYAAYKGEDVSARADLSAYSDADAVSSWAAETMSWAVAEGYISGMTADELQPQGNATRAQLAAILERFCVE